MVLLKALILFISILFITSCNSGKTDEEMEELWSKAQTTGKIIERSGTKFNSGRNKSLALQDAENRLSSGGGLLGKGGLSVGGLINRDKNKKTTNSVGAIGIPINIYLWRGALETVSFMPLTAADPIGGTILTDWYSTSNNEDERCKLNIFITGSELKTQNLKVTTFCQNYKNQKWVNSNIEEINNLKIEDAILNKAKKLKLESS